jgi:serine protease Do
VNLDGELVGVNSAILSRSGGSQGIGFAIPANLAMVVMDNLKEHGRVVRGYLGVRLQEVDANLALGLGLDEDVRGAAVASVEEGSAAERDGLKSGDVITAVDGEKVESMQKLRTLIGHTAPGTKVKLTVMREGGRKEVAVTLGTRPGEQPLAQAGENGGEDEAAVLEGLSVRDATPRLARHMNLPTDLSGPVIINVEPRTPAARSGLRPGDLILEVDRQAVDDAADFVDQVKAARKEHPDRPVLLTVQRGGAQVFVALAAR